MGIQARAKSAPLATESDQVLMITVGALNPQLSGSIVRGRNFLPLFRQGGVAHSGVYTIRIRAAAVSRVHDYGKALGDFRNGDPLVMELAAVDRRGSVESTGNVSKMTSLALVEKKKKKPQWFEWNVYMDAGYEPEVRFRNGPMAAKRMVRLLTTQAADRPEFSEADVVLASLEDFSLKLI